MRNYTDDRVQGSARWGEFGGACLLGEFEPDADLLLPGSSVLGLPKVASYLYGTWRNAEGLMYRALRGVESTKSDFAFLFATTGAGQLSQLATTLHQGPITIDREGEQVSFRAPPGAPGTAFSFTQGSEGCRWEEGDNLAMDGSALGPGMQWFNPWREGGGCFTATLKFASQGTFLEEPLVGFIGHEIHYMPAGRNWFNTRYGQGMEICWQQIANEYEDGTFVQATFGYGTEGWRFAMIHDELGGFRATTDVQIDADVRPNGYPERITYTLPSERWTWTIDLHGERAKTIDGAPLGADGTCRREGDNRTIVRSLGNSDWWDDGRYQASRRSG
jgi:hypothetical protein